MDTGPPLSRRARESAPGLQSDDGHLMPLLPFGPDGVREPKPSRTWDPSKLTTVVGSLNKKSHGRTTLVHGLGENRSAPLSAAAPVSPDRYGFLFTFTVGRCTSICFLPVITGLLTMTVSF